MSPSEKIPPLTGSVAFLSLHWARLRSHNDADMLILCDIHNGHRMSSGLWAPEGPLLTLGFVPCVTFRPWWHILSTTFNGEEKWWKISFILCTSSLPTNTAGTQSITTPFLQASCHLPSCFLGVTVPISSEGFETITLHDQRNFAVNIISYLQSIWLCALLGWSWACQKMDRLFFYMNGTTHLQDFPMGPLPILPSCGSMWNAGV